MADDGPSKKHKLPVQQLTVLSILRLAEPVALTSVFPYLPEMMEFLNIKSSEIGFYAGLTSAIFSLCQSLTGIPWGRASDYFGRKPAILAAVICSFISSLLFGFSRSLTWALVARALGGLSNGNVGLVRTAVAEMVPYKELQPMAFSIMPLVWSIGSVLGPAFGGVLAKPAQRFPDSFGGVWLWETFPFLLPNLVAAVIFIIGITNGVLFLKETLDDKKDRRDYGLVLGEKIKAIFSPSPATDKSQEEETAPLLKEANDDEENGKLSIKAKTHSSPTPPPAWRDVFIRQSNLNLIAYTSLGLHNIAADQLLSVFLHYPVRTSPPSANPFKFTTGFGLSSATIGLIFTIYGLFGMVVQFFIYPRAAAHFGVLNCYKFFSVVAPFLYLFIPFTALLPNTQLRIIFLIPILLLKIAAVIHNFPSSMILLTNSAKNKRLLGTLNGVAVSVSALGRAGGPVAAGALDTIGREHGYAVLPWFALALVSALGAVPIWWLEEKDGFGDDDETTAREEEAVVATTAVDGAVDEAYESGGETSRRQQ